MAVPVPNPFFPAAAAFVGVSLKKETSKATARPAAPSEKGKSDGNGFGSNKIGSGVENPLLRESAFGSSSASVPVVDSGGFGFGLSSDKVAVSGGGGGFSVSANKGFVFSGEASEKVQPPQFSFLAASSAFSATTTESPNNVHPKSKKKVYRASLQTKSTDALEGYEHYRSFMDKLAESGVDDYIDLPMIAVMGDTSSGKSSLLSNISLVELPSSDTLTTRCPIRLQMRHAAVRTASVKVVWKDRPAGDHVDFAERTVGEGNWNEITDVIAAAQRHIIEKSGKDVARDVVCVDMQGPHCENLTLIDLPGIVRSTGKDESVTLAEDIRALMQDYLNNERCVILAVHPSNVDFHNSQILAEAKKVDPKTLRTIPVLTKPDLIDEGAETNVKDLLLGNITDKFDMGFHMVKARGQKDLNEDVSIEDGLTKEEAFFRNKEPWRSIDQSKFGTKSLRVKLAGLQMKLIQASFKSIISEMKERSADAALELKALGDIPSTLHEKRSLFRNVRDEMREGLGVESLSGRITQLHSNKDTRPSAMFHQASKCFQDELNSSKLANISSIQVGTKVIAIVDGREVRDNICFVDDENVYIQKEVIRNISRDRWKTKPGNPFKAQGIVYFRKFDGTIDELKPIPLKLVHSDPQWISELIGHNRPYSLPIFLDPSLFDAIVADKIEKEWTKPTMQLLDLTATLMETASDKFINGINMTKSLPSLTEYLVRKSSELVECIKQDTKEEVLKFIKREQTPYTLNHYLFENLSKVRTQRLKEEILSSVDALGGAEKQVSTNDLDSAIQHIFERNQRRSIEDHMAEEMQNALDSYGKVAFKRFVDTIPMICVQILQRFPKMMNSILSDVTDNEIESLVVAPPGAINTMNALKKEVATLEKGIKTVKGLSKTGVGA